MSEQTGTGGGREGGREGPANPSSSLVYARLALFIFALFPPLRNLHGLRLIQSRIIRKLSVLRTTHGGPGGKQAKMISEKTGMFSFPDGDSFCG